MEETEKLRLAFGKVILDLREKKGVSQREVADNCNLERAYISRIERGIRQPTISIIFRLADYFNIEPSDLVAQVTVMIRKRRKVN